jgi:hypothetical protein
VENDKRESVFKMYETSWAGWLISVILDTQEVEIKRIMVQSQPQANSS